MARITFTPLAIRIAALGLRQREFARRAGVSDTTISDLVNGVRCCRLGTLTRVARALDMSPVALEREIQEGKRVAEKARLKALKRAVRTATQPCR